MTKNFDYRRPLSIAADEEMANAMADTIYGAVAEERAKMIRPSIPTTRISNASQTRGACCGIARIGGGSLLMRTFPRCCNKEPLQSGRTTN